MFCSAFCFCLQQKLWFHCCFPFYSCCFSFMSHRWTCRRKRWSTSCLWRWVPWLYRDQRRVNKRATAQPRGGEGGLEVERTAKRGQEPRREEGIPPPSVQSCVMRSELREHPRPFVFYSQGDPLKSPSLHSYMEKTPATVNKRHTWEALIFTFQTPDHGPSS